MSRDTCAFPLLYKMESCMTFRYTYFELNFPFWASSSRPHGCTLQHVWSTANLFPKVSFFFMLQGIVNVVRSKYDNK